MEMLELIMTRLLGLGPTIIMPILFMLIGLLVRVKLYTAFRSGITIGVGFIGLFAIIGIMVTAMEPVVQALLIRFHIDLPVRDIGWPASSAIAFSTKISTIVIPTVLAFNTLLIVLKATRTLWVDIWNYWHAAFVGSMVVAFTGDFWIGVLAMLVETTISLVIADRTKKSLVATLGNEFEGMSCPHPFAAAFAPIAYIVNKIIDLIPGVNKIKIDPQNISGKLGFIKEPIVLGFLVGAILAIVCGFDIAKSLELAITLAAVLKLMPIMSRLLMEGMSPITIGIQTVMEKRFSKYGNLHMGLDGAAFIGNPTILSVGLLMIPITLLLAAILPGNRILPFGSLPIIPFMTILPIIIVRGDFFRALVIAPVSIIIALYLGSAISPVFTKVAVESGYDIGGNALVSSFDYGAGLTPYTLMRLLEQSWGSIIAIIFMVALLVWNHKMILKETKEDSKNV
ncbi:MAG: PTS transporter subunit IIC [Brevinema sp.]